MSLDWPFYEQRHRDLADRLDAWASANLAAHHGDDVDAECRALVRELGAAGFLDLCVGADATPDVRSLAIARETLGLSLGPRRFRLRHAGPRLGRDQPRRLARAEGRVAAQGRQRARPSPPSP